MNNKDLKLKLDVISNLIASTSYYYQNLKFIVQDSDNNQQEIINKYPFLKNLENILWAVTILDLNKLLSSNNDTDHYNINKLLNEVINNFKNIKWQHPLKCQDIRAMKDKFNVNSSEIKNLQKIRSSYVAHYDGKNEIIDFKLDSLSKLLSLCQTTHDKLNYALSNSSTDWTYSYELIPSLITDLRKSNELRDLYFRNKVKLVDNVPFKEIEDVYHLTDWICR